MITYIYSTFWVWKFLRHKYLPMGTFLRYQKTLARGQEPIDWNFFNNRFLETFSSLLTLMAAVPDLQLQRLTPQKATIFGQQQKKFRAFLTFQRHMACVFCIVQFTTCTVFQYIENSSIWKPLVKVDNINLYIDKLQDGFDC